MAPEETAKIASVRQKMVEGTATLDELKEAVILMRGDRKAASSAAPAGGKKSSAKPKAVVNADDMLSELGGIDD